LHNWVIDLHNQIDLKDKLIEALELKLIQKEQQIEDMVDATYVANGLIQKVVAICDTEDLIQKANVNFDTDDLTKNILLLVIPMKLWLINKK
jgi:hypothetical protein